MTDLYFRSAARLTAPGALPQIGRMTHPTPRPVRDADAQDLFGLMSLCFSEYPGCFVDPHEDLRDLVKPATHAAEKGALFEVLEDETGRVYACASVDFDKTSGTAELHRVYVRADKRRGGIAGFLVERMERLAIEKGAKVMICFSDTRFLNAHRFYERRGYVRVGEARAINDISGTIEYRFEKVMAP